MNEVPTIPLVNLCLIRGQKLYDSQYALLVLSNYNKIQLSPTVNYTSGLRQLQLSNLTGGYSFREHMSDGGRYAHTSTHKANVRRGKDSINRCTPANTCKGSLQLKQIIIIKFKTRRVLVY